MKQKQEDKAVTEYWIEHYVHRNHCSLCGNTGVIDTRGAKTPAGFDCGRLNWCICPNGQLSRIHSGRETPPEQDSLPEWRRTGLELPKKP